MLHRLQTVGCGVAREATGKDETVKRIKVVDRRTTTYEAKPADNPCDECRGRGYIALFEGDMTSCSRCGGTGRKP